MATARAATDANLRRALNKWWRELNQQFDRAANDRLIQRDRHNAAFIKSYPAAASLFWSFADQERILANASNSVSTDQGKDPTDATNADKGAKAAEGGAAPPPGDEDPKKGDIKTSDDKQLKKDGIDAEKFKEDVIGKRRGGEFNVAVDKSTGEVYLTPVRRGAGEPIRTGYQYFELSNLFPRSGP